MSPRYEADGRDILAAARATAATIRANSQYRDEVSRLFTRRQVSERIQRAAMRDLRAIDRDVTLLSGVFGPPVAFVDHTLASVPSHLPRKHFTQNWLPGLMIPGGAGVLAMAAMLAWWHGAGQPLVPTQSVVGR